MVSFQQRQLEMFWCLMKQGYTHSCWNDAVDLGDWLRVGEILTEEGCVFE